MANRKVRQDAVEALAGVLFDGMTIMVGGLGLCGAPETLIAAIRASGVKNLTLVSNNCGVEDFGLGVLVAGGQIRQIRKMISSYVGETKLFEKLCFSGEPELELGFNPPGTLAERSRAGAPAFFTRTSVGAGVADGEQLRDFDGEGDVMARGLTADLSIVKAWKGDADGNLVYREAARNFNPMMAVAGKVTVAEVERLVAVGELGADQIHTPGIHIDAIVLGELYDKRVERIAARKRGASL